MKIKFNYQEWLNNPNRDDVKLVEEDGSNVYVYDFGNDDKIKHCVIVGGTIYNMDSDNVPIYVWVDDPRDDSVKNAKVSEHAEEFIKYASTKELNTIIECSNWFIDMAGIFGHYAFFTKELWRKVSGFEDADKAEVIAAFLHWWLRYEYGLQNHPAGMCWTTNHPTPYTEDDECYNDYIMHWMPLFKAYSDWCYNQR